MNILFIGIVILTAMHLCDSQNYYKRNRMFPVRGNRIKFAAESFQREVGNNFGRVSEQPKSNSIYITKRRDQVGI